MLKIVYPDPATGQESTASTVREYEYNANGEKTREKLRDDNTWIDFPRDDRGQVKSSSADGSTFKYDNAGRVTEASLSGQGTITNVYDGRGNLINQTGPIGGTGPQGSVRYEYDKAGRRTRMEWPDGYFVTYDYDAAGKLTEVKAGGTASLATFDYDTRDLRTRIDRGNGVSTTYGFGAAGRQESLAHTRGATPLVGYTYQRNAAGQIVGKTSSDGSWDQTAADPLKTYDGDKLNQYTRVGAQAPVHSARGNLTYEDASAGQSYDYDAYDRLTAANGSTLTYDALGRLASTTSPSGVRKLAYDDVDLIAVYDGANDLIERYVHGPAMDEPLVSYDTGGMHWLLADQLGSVVALTNSAGGVEAKVSFDDYGRGAPVSRFGFTGQAWLPDVGLYHFKARAYSPSLGRFLQPDPIGTESDENLYRYAANDPLNIIDPSGLDFVSVRPGGAIYVCRSTASTSAEADRQRMYTPNGDCIPATNSSDLTSLSGSLGGDTVVQALLEQARNPEPQGNGYSTCMAFRGTAAQCGAVSRGLMDQSNAAGGAMIGSIVTGLALGGAWVGGVNLYALGPEIKFASGNVRIAPFGNRTGNRYGEMPHYHRRVVGKDGKTLDGQGIGRHRSWEPKSPDRSFWDRF